jgi:undecaprenyl-diphosphatase
VLLAGVLGIWAYLRYVGPLPGDEAILRPVAGDQRYPSSHMLQFLGNLAAPSVAAATVAVAAVLVGRAIGPRAAIAVLLAALAVLVNEALRTLLGPTPAAAGAFGAVVENYPSGHTVYATSVFGLLAYLAWRHGRRDAAAVLVAVVVAMGTSRVLATAHPPSDVVGGYLLGGAWLLVVLVVHDALRPP